MFRTYLQTFKLMKNGVYFITLGWRVIQDFDLCKLKVSEYFFCIELKLCTVVTIITKFHDMSTVTFPWQYNRTQALSIQRIKSEFSAFKKGYFGTFQDNASKLFNNLPETIRNCKDYKTFLRLSRNFLRSRVQSD